MDLMDIRRTMMGVIASMASEHYSIELYPVGSERIIPCVQFTVTEGQKLTVKWKADAAYTNRYFLRTLNARLNNGGTYQIYTPAGYGLSGEEIFTVTTAGNVLFAGYSVGLVNTCLIGDYVKIKIENPAE